MTEWTVLILALLALLICQIVRRYRLRPRGCVFVPGHWLLGNALQHIRAMRQNKHAYEQHKLYGRTLALKVPLAPWIVKTTDPKTVEHILKTNFENYTKHGRIRACLEDFLGNSISVAEGPQWREQRQIASHMFTAKLLQEHIWVVVRRNARKLRDVLESVDSSVGKPVDVFNLMNRFTLDTMGEIGFGKCIGSLDDPESPFLHSFEKVQQIVFCRVHNPIWKIFRMLGVDYERETKEHFGNLDQYTRTVVQELIETMSRGNSKSGGVVWADIEARKSFVGLFLEDASNSGEKLSEDYLRDLILNILISGRDTAAQALSWTVYCLCKNPDVEAKARKEVVDVCGVRGPSFDDMPSLPYLQAVIKEALRLYPSVPIDARMAQADDTLPDGTFIPRGTEIIYDIYSMGRDHEIWGDDAEEFRPERWMEMEQAPSSYEYPVFNAGPRDCLGKNLVMLQMKTCLAFLLPHMSFELAVSADEIIAESKLTLGMSSGLPCIVKAVTAGQHLGSNASTTIRSSDSEASSVADACDVCTSDGMSEADELVYQASDFAEDDEDRDLQGAGPTRPSTSFSSDDKGKNPRRFSAQTPHASKVVAQFGSDSESETTIAEFGVDTASSRDFEAESEATWDELGGDINEDSTSESAATSRGGRIRGKKRKSGWSRRRRSQFWRTVRELTPERYPEYSDSGYSSVARSGADPNTVAALQRVENPPTNASPSTQAAASAQMHGPQFAERPVLEPPTARSDSGYSSVAQSGRNASAAAAVPTALPTGENPHMLVSPFTQPPASAQTAIRRMQTPKLTQTALQLSTPLLQQTPAIFAPNMVDQSFFAAHNHVGRPEFSSTGLSGHPQSHSAHTNFPLKPMMQNPNMQNPALSNAGFQVGCGGVFPTYACAPVNTFVMYPRPAFANIAFANPALISPSCNF